MKKIIICSLMLLHLGLAKAQSDEFQVISEKANQGSVEDQTKLGWMYQYGDGVPQDLFLAFGWYSKAAAQGNPIAQTYLGMLYQTGDGVSQDKFQALTWYRKAADQGSIMARYKLAMMYYEGDGVNKNDALALYYFKKSKYLGKLQAKILIGNGIEAEEPSEDISSEQIIPEVPKLPANLVITDLILKDADVDNTVNAFHTSVLRFKLKNTGKGYARNIFVNVNDLMQVQGLVLPDNIKIRELTPETERILEVKVVGGSKLVSAKTQLQVIAKEGNGFDADPVEISIKTQAFKPAKMVITGYEFFADHEGVVKKGDVVALKVTVKNEGLAQAKDVKVKLNILQKNVYQGDVPLALDFPIVKSGETKMVVFNFFANKRYAYNKIPLDLVVSEYFGKYGDKQSLIFDLDKPVTDLSKLTPIINSALSIPSASSTTNTLDNKK